MIIKGTNRDGFTRAEKMTKSYHCEACRQNTLVLRYEHPNYRLLCGKCGSEVFYKPKSATQQWFEDPASVGPAVQITMENLHFRAIDAMVEGLPEEAQQAARERYGIQNKIRKEKKWESKG